MQHRREAHQQPHSKRTGHAGGRGTVCDTATCKITLDGAETTVEDKTTGEQYSFTTTRKLSTTPPTLEQMQARCIARTSADTDSIKIELAGALIVVHDRAGNQTYYIDP